MTYNAPSITSSLDSPTPVSPFSPLSPLSPLSPFSPFMLTVVGFSKPLLLVQLKSPFSLTEGVKVAPSKLPSSTSFFNCVTYSCLAVSLATLVSSFETLVSSLDSLTLSLSVTSVFKSFNFLIN